MIDDLDHVVAHQANQRILDAVADELGLPSDRVVSNIELVGNTSAASIPLALVYAARSGALVLGHRVLLTAFGGGLTWGSTVSALAGRDRSRLEHDPARLDTLHTQTCDAATSDRVEDDHEHPQGQGDHHPGKKPTVNSDVLAEDPTNALDEIGFDFAGHRRIRDRDREGVRHAGRRGGVEW